MTNYQDRQLAYLNGLLLERWILFHLHPAPSSQRALLATIRELEAEKRLIERAS